MNRYLAATPDRISVAERALWLWLALGILLVTVVPTLLARDPVLGWLPFWLVVAPAFDLAVLHRGRLWATARGFLFRARHRRRSARQARRLRHRRGARVPFAMARERRMRLRAALP